MERHLRELSADRGRYDHGERQADAVECEQIAGLDANRVDENRVRWRHPDRKYRQRVRHLERSPDTESPEELIGNGGGNKV